MGTVMIVLFGILLPAVALCIEFGTGMCAEAFFDPIPTPWHILLVAFVPLANLLALVGSGCNWMKGRAPLLWANGIAMGISAVYVMVFLPITPMAVLAIIFMGMGLLPLAPFSSLLCAIALRRRILNMSEINPAAKEIGPTHSGWSSPASLLVGGLLGILLVLMTEVTSAVTLIGAKMTQSDSQAQRTRGINILRRFGNKDEMLRMCYRGDGAGMGDFGFRAGKSRSMIGFLFPAIPRIDAQKLFFRVTGKAFNSLPPPRGVNPGVRDEFDFDPDLGGQTVAGIRKGLSLSGSSIDVQLQRDAAISYTEWTLIFRNEHSQQREARAQIIISPGGVVSRVSLWVNGEPCEAAFAGSSLVREAYQKVAVQQRRDPLLVTWAGPDRVMIQCFPVPPHGEMKIRLGITAPLGLPGDDTAVLRLPCFAERNFSITDQKVHSLWIESDCPYNDALNQLNYEKADNAKHVLRGTLSDNEISAADAKITVSSPVDAAEIWTPDQKDAKKYILQKQVAKPIPIKRQIFLVVDGSAGMAEQYDAVAESLIGLPENTELHVLVASDEVIDLTSAATDHSAKGAKMIAERLHTMAGAGGCDNLPALLQALEGSIGGDKTIIWIHAAQPVILQPAMPLAHWMERDPQIILYDLAVTNSTNRLAEELRTIRGLHEVPRFGTVAGDLKSLLLQLTGQKKQYVFERNQVEGQPPKTPQALSNLAQLWAADQVAELTGSGKPSDHAEAVKLAASYRIVTPVSGAVVLENRQQYKDSKLEPPDQESAASTPEPASYILLLTAMPVFLWIMRRYRRYNNVA
jgi:hypothetical protein